MTAERLVIGGVTIALAAVIGGISGFGASLFSAPLLLLLGFPLPFVVTVNLAIVGLSRLSLVVRFREYIALQRVCLLVLGSLPGGLLGSWLLASTDQQMIKRATGIVVMLAVVVLARARRRPVSRQVAGAAFIAGLIGGALGSTTSLNGIPAVILLARDRAAPRTFLADLALYFVAGNLLTLGLLAARGTLVFAALFPTALVWLPGALAGNWLGATLGTRLPEETFYRLTLVLAFITGTVTALTA